MIPKFKSNGNLPPGIYSVLWPDFIEKFGWNFHRKRLMSGLREALSNLTASGCKRVFIDGSFVTTKEFPNDYDVLWDPENVDIKKIDPVFLQFDNHRAAQKFKYLGEFFPSSMNEAASETTFMQFFQIDKNTGESKGIIMLETTQFGGA